MAKGYAPDEGGMQTYARCVAEAYAGLGARVTVFTQSSAGPRHIVLDGVELIDIGPGKGVGVAWRLWRALRRQRRLGPAPSIVHGTTWRTSLLPALMKLPLITTVHGREIMHRRGPTAWLLRWVLARARRIVAVSGYTRDRLAEAVPGARAVVAWNGVSAGIRTGELADGDDVPVILTLCRLERRKNVHGALAAIAVLVERGYRLRHIVCGRGPELTGLTRQVETLGLVAHVEIKGFVPQDEALALYARADIFLHPQIAVDDGRDFEGFGIAIADAMAARTACVVGRDGGTPEMFPTQDLGFVVDGENTAAIVDALEMLLRDPALRARMAQNAFAWATRNLTWRRHCLIALEAGDEPGDGALLS